MEINLLNHLARTIPSGKQLAWDEDIQGSFVWGFSTSWQTECTQEQVAWQLGLHMPLSPLAGGTHHLQLQFTAVARGAAGGNWLQEIDRPEARKALMGESQIGKAPEGFGSRMALVIAVCLHVCCCRFSPVSDMVWMGVGGGSPLPLM